MNPPLLSGKYEDLIQLILRLQQRTLERERRELPAKPTWQRGLLDFPLNLLGAAFALLLRCLPNRVSHAIFLKSFDLLTYNKYRSVGIYISLNNECYYKLYTYVKSIRREPALLCLTSHPPVIGDIRGLNLGLMAAGFRLMRAIRGTGRPFRLVAAIDVMALDTLSLVEEAVYAGVVGYFHVSTDRLPSQRNAAQRLLFRRFAFDSAAWRLADSLLARENVVLVHPGGVAETSRLISTTREFVWRLRQETRKRPWDILDSISCDPAFRPFLHYFVEGGSLWRRIESFLVGLLARDPLVQCESNGSSPPCTTGILDPSDHRAVLSVAKAFGLDPEEARRAVDDFDEEFSRITPYRIRLFRILIRRVVSAGVPLMILPLDFSTDPDRPIIRKSPLALVPGGDNSIEAVSLEGGVPIRTYVKDLDFFLEWGKATFSN